MAKKAEKYLVIVESPAKAKTIGKYLGPAYQVKACMGHLRDLPKSKLGVDVENDFEPNYRPIKGKEDIIRDLKQAAKDSDAVYLATDPDREGEAISWHLKQLLDLPEDKTFRVTFNEITRKVVTESIRQPRDIDQDLVDAQQARRILDRIVGYELSPLLWKKIRRGLSAGRVQSVAMRLVADREKEIADFVPQEYWTLDALLQNDQGARFKAHYYGRCGKKYEPTSQQEVDGIRAQLQDTPFAVSNVKRTDKRRSPSPPFTTSTMQQEASRKLNMTPRRTMANIEYEYLLRDNSYQKDVIEEILNLIVETVSVKRKTVRIAGADYPYEAVKGKFLKLDMGHIQYVLDCMDKNTTKVRNIKNYLLTALYNAPNTIGNYYQSEVNYDMKGGF